MPEKIALVFFAGNEVAQSADCNNRFLVDRNFYYLTGITEPMAKLVMVKDSEDVKITLYVLPKDDMKERWQGKRKVHSEYSEVSGISEENIRDLEQFTDDMYELYQNTELKFGYDGSSIMSAMKEFCTSLAQIRVPADIIDIKDYLTAMRMVKKPCEIEAIREAARITEDAIADTLEVIKPGMTEYDFFVKLEYEMARRSCLIPAFETIVAVDENVFYLHHNNPDRTVIKDGDVIQLDLGARVDGYCADISRAIFIGTSSDAEKMERREKLHGLIVTLRREAFKFIKPGETFKTLNEKMRAITWEWLVNEGLIQMKSESNEIDVNIVSNYYWHNTSHHLGLDVHDISDREKPFENGNCLAVEPGVYIKEWGLGFRIEDDVVVTEDGCSLISSGKDDLEVYPK